VRSHIEESKQVSAVVFDLGGVLLDWDPRHLYRKLFSDEAAMERFLNDLCTPAWHEPHDRGVPAAESCAQLALRNPEFADLIWAWSERSEEMVAGAISESVEILKDILGAGMACFALTNMEAETYPLRLERFPFLDWFEGTVVSGQEGVSKPDPEIFIRMIDRFNLTTSATLMIDDNEDNLLTASSLGMLTVQFHSPSELRRSLETVGILGSR
jgi:2-haloacid dehalogenase